MELILKKKKNSNFKAITNIFQEIKKSIIPMKLAQYDYIYIIMYI